ncbi:unnamed protein product [Darwinula stevensoni]|uniref:PKD/REJ-like domain-containing protein n=1 Tax=Darwinula stevensoni TaxID=69355 RepID=A0A7R9A0U9_9CRUS|nr:unnamed protein product [Darwinula stevensoni]CAG0882021.1 unnamed protein product [Darwinula stevensoni]
MEQETEMETCVQGIRCIVHGLKVVCRSRTSVWHQLALEMASSALLECCTAKRQDDASQRILTAWMIRKTPRQNFHVPPIRCIAWLLRDASHMRALVPNTIQIQNQARFLIPVQLERYIAWRKKAVSQLMPLVVSKKAKVGSPPALAQLARYFETEKNKEKAFSCSSGKVYCQASGKCVEIGEECMFNEGDNNVCAPGMVYCSVSETCVEPDFPCEDMDESDGDTDESDEKLDACPLNHVWNAECEACTPMNLTTRDQCDLVQGISFGADCLESDQCPDGAICCPTGSKGFTCIGKDGKPTGPSQNSTNCETEYFQPTGAVCNSKSDCQNLEFCCRGFCYVSRVVHLLGSSPSTSSHRRRECSTHEQYCSLSERCQSVTSTCGEPCIPTTVLCKPNAMCALEAACPMKAETPVARTIVAVVLPSGGALVMNAPEVLTAPEDSAATFSISDSFSVAWQGIDRSPSKLQNFQTLRQELQGMVKQIGSLEGIKAYHIVAAALDLPLRLGLVVEFKDKPNTRSEILGQLEVFHPEDRRWEVIGPRDSALVKTSQGSLMRFKPNGNFHGEVTFLVRPFSQIDELTWFGDSKEVLLKIESLNDAPKSKLTFNPLEFPSMPLQGPDPGMYVRDVVSVFYEDPDGDDLGMSILYADVSSLGRWQYSPDNGNAWNNIALSDHVHPVPEKLQISPSYLGPVKAVDVIRNTICDTTAQTPEVDVFSQNLKCMNLYGDSDRLSEAYMSFQQQNAGLQATSAVFPLGTGNVALKFNTTTALLLGPKYKIRFNPNQQMEWSLSEAMRKARIAFTAWDMTDGRKPGGTIQMEIPVCVTNCGKSGSLSADITVAYARQRDCTGGPSVGTPLAVDQCGVCGGDGTSCLDCNGKPSGGAIWRCGTCVGAGVGSDAEEALLDCAGECILGRKPQNEIIQKANLSICIPTSMNQSFTFCDGSSNSGAFIDICGDCKSRGVEPVMACSKICSVNGSSLCVGCNGEPLSGWETDMCGKCHSPESPGVNDCVSIWDWTPHAFDRAMYALSDVDPQLILIGAGLSRNSFLKADCYLKHESGTIVDVKGSEVYTGKILIKLKAFNDSWPLLGGYGIHCVLKRVGKEVELDGNPSRWLDVVDSRNLATTSISPSSPVVGSSFELVAKSSGQVKRDYGGSCFLFLESTGEIFSTPSVLGPDGQSFKCNATFGRVVKLKVGFSFLAGSEPFLLGASMKEVTIKDSNPVAPGITYSEDLRKIFIVFDRNVKAISGTNENFCARLVSGQNWLSGWNCEIVGNLLELEGNVSTLTQKVSLNLGAAGGLQRAGSLPQLAAALNMTVTVTPPTAANYLIIPDIQLSGGGKLCGSGASSFFVMSTSGEAGGSLEFTWNISVANQDKLDAGTIQTAATAIQGLNLPRLPTSTRQITFQTDNFPSASGNGNATVVEYQVAVTARNWIGHQNTLLRGFTLLPQNNMGISAFIRGPSNILADGIYNYEMLASSCQGPNASVTFSYFWSLDGIGEEVLTSTSGNRVSLKKDVLLPGRTYTLRCLAVSDDTLGLATQAILMLNVQRGRIPMDWAEGNSWMDVLPEARMGAKGYQMLLKAFPSQSEATWTCGKITDQATLPCLVGPNLERLENHWRQDFSILSATSVRLPIGIYELGWTGKEDSNEEYRMRWKYVQEDSIPEITVPALFYRLDIGNDLVIRASISSSSSLFAYWEALQRPGFGYLDVSLLKPKQSFLMASSSREFNLVISGNMANDLAWNTPYLFRLHAIRDGKEAYLDVLVVTNAPPQYGSFRVAPVEGKALVTNFQFTVDKDWLDFSWDMPFSYRFGYVWDSTEPPKWFGNTPLSVPVLETTLPGDPKKPNLIPVMEVCDAHSACQVTFGSPIQLGIPTSLSLAQLSDLTNQMQEMRSEDPFAALSLGRSLLNTLRQMNSSPEAIQSMEALVQEGLRSSLQDFKLRLMGNPKTLDTGINFLGETSSTVRDMKFVDNSTRDEIGSLLSVITENLMAPQTQNLVAVEGSVGELLTSASSRRKRMVKREVRTSTESSWAKYLPDFVIGTNNREKRASGELLSSGSLASTADYFTSSKPFTIENAKIFLSAAELTNMKPQDMILQLHVWMSGLCQTLVTVGQSVTLSSESLKVSLSVSKESLEGKAGEEFTLIPANDTYLDSSVPVMMNSDLVDAYSSWDCRGDHGSCDTVCLAGASSDQDYLAAVANDLNAKYKERRSDVYEVRMIDDANGKLIGQSSFKDPLKIILPVKDTSVPRDFRIHCFFTERPGTTWDNGTCTSRNVKLDGGNYVECSCPHLGYVRAGTELDNFRVWIDNDRIGNDWVRDDRNGNDRVRDDRNGNDRNGNDRIGNDRNGNDRIGNDRNGNDRIGNDRNGNHWDRDDRYNRDDWGRLGRPAYDALKEKAKTGMNFTLPTGETLTLPPQNLDGSMIGSENSPKDYTIPLIIGCVAGVVIVLIIVFVIFAIVTKNRKRSQKIRPLGNSLSSGPTTYRTPQFEQSLEGFAGSYGVYQKRGDMVNSPRFGTMTEEEVYVERKVAEHMKTVDWRATGNRRNSLSFRRPSVVPSPMTYHSPTPTSPNKEL